MNIESWKQAWEMNKIGFHKSKPHPFLVNHFNQLELVQNSRVFIPLCGKTLDIAWLLSQGYQVAGAELSHLAIEQLFQEMDMQPTITKLGKVERYSAENIDIFVGNIMDISIDILGSVDGIYDRAALVALPLELRKLYAQLLIDITDSAPQLLITFEYDDSLKSGPAFSVNSTEINQHYGDAYGCKLLDSYPLPGGLKGSSVTTENIWLLQK